MNVVSEKILSKYGKNISGTGLELRDFLLQHLAGVTEQPDESAGIIGFNYGAGYKGLICIIIPSKKGIKLGFYKGSQLPDPHQLLKGSGKVHRYVEINSRQAIHTPALSELLSRAVIAYKKRIA